MIWSSLTLLLIWSRTVKRVRVKSFTMTCQVILTNLVFMLPKAGMSTVLALAAADLKISSDRPHTAMSSRSCLPETCQSSVTILFLQVSLTKPFLTCRLFLRLIWWVPRALGVSMHRLNSISILLLNLPRDSLKLLWLCLWLMISKLMLISMLHGELTSWTRVLGVLLSPLPQKLMTP